MEFIWQNITPNVQHLTMQQGMGATGIAELRKVEGPAAGVWEAYVSGDRATWPIGPGVQEGEAKARVLAVVQRRMLGQLAQLLVGASKRA